MREASQEAEIYVAPRDACVERTIDLRLRDGGDSIAEKEGNGGENRTGNLEAALVPLLLCQPNMSI